MKQMPPKLTEALKTTFTKRYWEESFMGGGRKKPRMKRRRPLAKRKRRSEFML